jgi:SAM-dependent methyltransferase
MAEDIEQRVSRHYAHGDLERAILDALAASGRDPDRLAPDDLAPVDEFHIGGRAATAALMARLGIAPGAHVLDVGSGLGGAARYAAVACSCRVTGIDLTAEYVRVARVLARRVGLDDRVDFRQGSALDLPFPAASFGCAYMLHVGMNIADKAALFAGVRRVLRPGAVFGVYDVMGAGDGAPDFPVPWAAGAETSFLERPDRYRLLLEEADFTVEGVRDRRDFALEAFAAMRTRARGGPPPPLGLHLLSPEAPLRFANMIAGVEAGVIAPVEIVCRAR